MPRLSPWMLTIFALSSMVLAACGDDDGKEADEDSHSRITTKAPSATVNIDLIEFKVTPDKASVAAGPIKFIAKNTSKLMVHELAVLLVKADGTFENTGEIEDIEAGKSSEVVLDLPAGKYQLACLLVPGEAGSTTDHFKEGMKIDFEVK